MVLIPEKVVAFKNLSQFDLKNLIRLAGVFSSQHSALLTAVDCDLGRQAWHGRGRLELRGPRSA